MIGETRLEEEHLVGLARPFPGVGYLYIKKPRPSSEVKFDNHDPRLI